MSVDGKGAKWRRNIAENFNRLNRVASVTDRRQTDRQTDGRLHIANVAKNSVSSILGIIPVNVNYRSRGALTSAVVSELCK